MNPSRDGHRIAFEGAHNFRDVGGYAGFDGRIVRRGLIYRSDNLNTLTDADLERFGRMGLKVVYDFRLAVERERQPSRLPKAGPDIVLLATGDAGIDETVVDIVIDALAGRRPFPEPGFWEESYLNMVDQARPMFVELLGGLARRERIPAMYHCTAGKDRTGIATALLHRLLGVAEADIIHDFLLTNDYRVPKRMDALRPQLAAIGISDEEALSVVGVKAAVLERALKKIDATWGGAEQYLIDGGLDAGAPQGLRDLLLEP